MPPAAAEPPAAPPAPATSPTPAPAAAPPTPPAKPTMSSGQPVPESSASFDAMAELESLANPKPVEKPAEKPAATAPPAPKQPEAAAKPPETPAKPAEPPTPPEPVVAGTAKELRAAYENTKKELAAIKAELEKAKKPVEDPEKKTFAEQLEAERKQRESLEAELRATNWERSQDYKDKYVKPLERAFDSAYGEIKSLQVKTPDGATRPGTVEDFNMLVQLPLADASNMSKLLFGDAAGDVMAMRRQIIDLNRARQADLEDFKTKSASAAKEKEAQRLLERERRQSVWNTTIKTMQDKFPELFAPVEGDAEGNELLEKGTKLADLVFSGVEMAPEKQAELHAMVRNKAAAFDRMVRMTQRQSEQIKSLEKELEAFKASSPGNGNAGGGTPAVKEKTWEDELNDLTSR